MLVDQKFWFSALTHERRKALCSKITEKVALIAIDKSSLKMPKMVHSGDFLVKNAKIQKFKCDILSDFQTLWESLNQSFDNM